MLKKLSIVFLLSLANAVLLGHSIIPHHHNDDDVIAHHQDHHDNDKDEGNPLGDLFAHFQHYDKKEFTYLKADQQLTKSTISLPFWNTEQNFDFSIGLSAFEPIFPERPHYYSPPSFSFRPLRAPPATA